MFSWKSFYPSLLLVFCRSNSTDNPFSVARSRTLVWSTFNLQIRVKWCSSFSVCYYYWAGIQNFTFYHLLFSEEQNNKCWLVTSQGIKDFQPITPLSYNIKNDPLNPLNLPLQWHTLGDSEGLQFLWKHSQMQVSFLPPAPRQEGVLVTEDNLHDRVGAQRKDCTSKCSAVSIVLSGLWSKHHPARWPPG